MNREDNFRKRSNDKEKKLMAEKNRQIAEAVVKAVGGTANITSVTHCMTRLRFVLKDKSIPTKKR